MILNDVKQICTFFFCTEKCFEFLVFLLKPMGCFRFLVGVAQALRGREGAAGEALREAQLVVTSPLTRAMQTTGVELRTMKREGRKCIKMSKKEQKRCDL